MAHHCSKNKKPLFKGHSCRSHFRLVEAVRRRSERTHKLPFLPRRRRYLGWILGFPGDGGNRRHTSVSTGRVIYLMMLGLRCTSVSHSSGLIFPSLARSISLNVSSTISSSASSSRWTSGLSAIMAMRKRLSSGGSMAPE